MSIGAKIGEAFDASGLVKAPSSLPDDVCDEIVFQAMKKAVEAARLMLWEYGYDFRTGEKR